MKKIILTVLLSLSAAGTSFALNNTQAMRFLMVNSMMEYGQTLYDRGDFSQATAVFNHVLVYDKHQPRALYYLKQMGYGLPEKQMAVVPAPDLSSLGATLEDLDTQSLQQAIDAKKQSIERLQHQIRQMRENLTS